MGKMVTSPGMNAQITENNETIEKIQEGIAIIVDGDTASKAVPVDGYAYIKNNTHGLAEGLYTNTGSSAFPASGGTADSTVFTPASDALNALNSKLPQYSTDEKIVGSFNGHAIYEKTYFSDTNASSAEVILDNRDFFKNENAYAIVSIEGAVKTGGGNIHPVDHYANSTYYIVVVCGSTGLSLNTGGWRNSGYFITVRYIKT